MTSPLPRPLPPPGTSRPRPPLALPALPDPTEPPVAVEALAPDGAETPTPTATRAITTIATGAPWVRLPPPRADTAWPTKEDQDHRRRVVAQRLILCVGYVLVTAGLGMVAYTGWLLDSTPVWYLWWPAAIAPAVVVVIGAAIGWRNVVIIAVLAAAWYGVLATVDLVVSTPVGVVEVPVALAAIGVTAAAWAVDPHPLDQSAPDQPPLANTAG